MLKKFLLFLLGLISLLLLAFLIGPRLDYDEINPKITKLDLDISVLNSYIAEKESNVKFLKQDNQSRIVWANDEQVKTEYAIVYLHGFSASPMESKPIHLDFAKRFNCNMYLPRLAGHGLDNEESFLNVQPSDWIESAKEAVAIGNIIGEKVIIMSCSTGSTLAVPIAAENQDMVDAQIMLSPNFELYDARTKLITGPWGGQIARKIHGSDYRNLRLPKVCHQFWTMRYRLEGGFAVQGLIDQSIKEAYFKKLTHPVFMGFYYKNEEESDHIISTKAVRHCASFLPGDKNVIKPFENAGGHIIASECQSKDLNEVQTALWNFAQEQLGFD